MNFPMETRGSPVIKVTHPQTNKHAWLHFYGRKRGFSFDKDRAIASFRNENETVWKDPGCQHDRIVYNFKEEDFCWLHGHDCYDWNFLTKKEKAAIEAAQK